MEDIIENQSLLIGLTGGIGSGKSTVARRIEEAGFTVLSADSVARTVIETNIEVRSELQRLFGDVVFKVDGSLDRTFLSELVFGESIDTKNAIKKLNNIVHPFVLDELLASSEKLAEQGENCIFIELPLLFEIGLEDAFDYTILVVSPEQTRIDRVMKRSNLTEDQIRRRMAEQVSPEQIKGIADFVIENNGTVEKLQQSVDFLIQVIPYLPPVDPEIDENNSN